MRTLTNNIYLFVGLGLLAYAIFVVFTSNLAISDNYRLAAIQAENQQLKDHIAVLENKIASLRSVGSVEAAEALLAADFVSIDERELVTNTLASL